MVLNPSICAVKRECRGRGKEPDVRRRREGEMETGAKDATREKREKPRGQRDRKARKRRGNDPATFLGLNLPADRRRLHFPLAGRHGGEL